MNGNARTRRRPSSVREAQRKAEAADTWEFYNGEEPVPAASLVCTHDTPVGHRCGTCGNVKREPTRDE